MRFYVTAALLFFIFPVLAEIVKKETEDVMIKLDEENNALRELIYKLQTNEGLSEEDKKHLEYVNETFCRNNDGLKYYLRDNRSS